MQFPNPPTRRRMSWMLQKREWLFSSFCEANNSYFWSNIALLQENDESIIVVDGASEDATLAQLSARGIVPTILPGSTRGQRYHRALQNGSQEILVFVHPRTRLSKAVIDRLRQLPPEQQWGAFTHRFDDAHPLLSFTSWWSNFVRGDLGGIFYLDHILWSRRELALAVGGFPHEPIFEDTLFCQRLLSLARPVRYPEVTVTSAVRFRKNGILKQILLNQVAKLRFYWGTDFDATNKSYERGLELNGKLTSQGQQPAAEDPAPKVER